MIENVAEWLCNYELNYEWSEITPARKRAYRLEARDLLSLKGEHNGRATELVECYVEGELPPLPCVGCDKYINGVCTDNDPECSCMRDDDYSEAQHDMLSEGYVQKVERGE